jgi:hypothetical protein
MEDLATDNMQEQGSAEPCRQAAIGSAHIEVLTKRCTSGR